VDRNRTHRHAVTAEHQRKPLPAYGRELLELRRQGLVPERGFCNAHVIVCLDCWDIARNRCRLVVARDADPLSLDFMAVAGLDVLVAVNSTMSDQARRDATVRAILTGNPASLYELDARAPHQGRFIKSRALGIELQEFAA